MPLNTVQLSWVPWQSQKEGPDVTTWRISKLTLSFGPIEPVRLSNFVNTVSYLSQTKVISMGTVKSYYYICLVGEKPQCGRIMNKTIIIMNIIMNYYINSCSKFQIKWSFGAR